MSSAPQLLAIKGNVSSISCNKDGFDSAALVTTFAHGCTYIRVPTGGPIQATSVVKDYFSNCTFLTSSALCADQHNAVVGDVHGHLFLMSLLGTCNSSSGLLTITPPDFPSFGPVRSLSLFADQPHHVLCTYASRSAIVDLRCQPLHSLVIGYCVPHFLSALGGQPVGSLGSEFAVGTKEGALLFFDMRRNREEPTEVVTCGSSDHLTAIASNERDTVVLGAVSGRCYFVRSADSSVVEQAVAVTGARRSAVLSLACCGRHTLVGTSDGRSAIIRPDCPQQSHMFPPISRGGDPDFSSVAVTNGRNTVEAENAEPPLQSTNCLGGGSSCSAVAISSSHMWITETADAALKSYVEVRPMSH
jgi:hypothetical protein